MIFRAGPAAIRFGIPLACVLVFGMGRGIAGWSQTAAQLSGESAGVFDHASAASLSNQPISSAADLQATQSPTGQNPDALVQWAGLPVRQILFEGVATTRLAPLPGHLAQAEGAPLSPEALKKSLRQLFATGLFETIQVEGMRQQEGVALVFKGLPRTFIGTVTVSGAKGDSMNTQVERASQLEPGTRFTQAKLDRALEQMRNALAVNGFNEPAIAQTLTPHPEEQLMDIAFQVTSGPQTRVGTVEVTGDSGMTSEEFRRHAHLRSGAHVDHETANRALTGVLKHYQGQERLEAEIKLESERYQTDTKRTDFHFSASMGPKVRVRVDGVSLGPERIKHVIPIFEEGTVDDDLLNEGNRTLRNYYQRLGFLRREGGSRD